MAKWDKGSTREIAKKENLSRVAATDEWKQIRSIFINKIIDLQSIMNVANESPEKMAADIAARIAAVDILREVMSEVEGSQVDLQNLIKGESRITEAIVLKTNDEIES